MSFKDKCMGQFRNCLGILFPQLLEGLTPPEERGSLPSRQSKAQYERVKNPNNNVSVFVILSFSWMVDILRMLVNNCYVGVWV